MLIKLKFCHVHALRLNRGCMKVYYLFIYFLFLKVHVFESSVIPDHCRRFALSDCKCSDNLEACNHIHDGACDLCSLTERSIQEVEDALSLVAARSEELEELSSTVNRLGVTSLPGKLIFS